MPKSFLKISTLITAVVYLLYAAILVPLYEYIICDVALLGTFFVDVVDFFMHWTEFLGATFMIIFCALAVYHSKTLVDARAVFIAQGVVLVSKYIISIIAFSILHDSFIDFTLNFDSYFGALFIEAAVITLATYFVWRFTSKQNEQNRQKQNAAKALGIEIVPPTPLLPFAHLFAKGNPLQKALRLGVGIFTGARLLAFVLGDIAFSKMGFAFKLSDLPITVLYVFLLVLIPGFLSYLLAHVLIGKFHLKKDSKLKHSAHKKLFDLPHNTMQQFNMTSTHNHLTFIM